MNLNPQVTVSHTNKVGVHNVTIMQVLGGMIHMGAGRRHAIWWGWGLCVKDLFWETDIEHFHLQTEHKTDYCIS